MNSEILELINQYATKHNLAKELGSEYIMQDDKAQCDALELVCNIFDLYVKEGQTKRNGDKDMKKEITFSTQFRRKIYDELSEEDYTIQNLKGIVQNEMPIKEEYIKTFLTMKEKLIERLDKISTELKEQYEKQVWEENGLL